MDDAQLSSEGFRRAWMIAAALAALIIAWALAILVVEQLQFVIQAPKLKVPEEAATSLARMFAALVLYLFASDRASRRLRWVALGLLVLGLGGFMFDSTHSLTDLHTSFSTATYAWLVVSTVAAGLFATGLGVPSPPALSRSRATAVLLGFLALCVLVFAFADYAPAVLAHNGSAASLPSDEAPMDGLTGWYWGISLIPLALAVLALTGTIREVRAGRANTWLLLAIVLFAGAEVHNLFWPSAYSTVLTTADVLRLAFAVTVTLGGIVELHRIAARRAALLAGEQDHTRRLQELATAQASFTAMVAHELGSPVAAIYRVVDLLEGGRIDQVQALQAIRTEATMVQTLVADVQGVAQVESDVVASSLRPVPLQSLLETAATFARALPGHHEVAVQSHLDKWVIADPQRLQQVLRNLLSNAAKYSPPGTRIELRCDHVDGRVEIKVVDHGHGIDPTDMSRIFQKFGRGHHQGGRHIPGTGLGLYLAQRIVRTHGSELEVESSPGVGSIFRFWLPAAPPPERGSPGDPSIIHVLIVDDHVAFRQPLATVLEQEPNLTIVGEAGTISEALPLLERADVVVVDLDLPDGPGVDLIREARARSSGTRVLVLTASADRREIGAAVEAGAAGVLQKVARVEEIVDALRAIAGGSRTMSHQEALELVRLAVESREHERAAQLALEQLTRREREVLDALSDGLSDKEIAVRLGITPATARTHVIRVLGKLGAHSRLEAVRTAMQYGIVQTR